MSTTPKNIILMKWYCFLTSLRFFAAIQILYFVKVTGSFSLGMSIFAVSTMSQALFEIPTGIYSDTIGRKKTTIFAAVSAVLSVTLYAIGYSYWFLFLGAVIEGLARALGSGNNQALMYDSLKDMDAEDQLYKHLGTMGKYESIGFGMTALVGGYIASFSFAIVMWLTVITQICAFVVTLFLKNPLSRSQSQLNPYAHLKEAILAFKNNPQLRRLTIARAMKGSIGEAAYQFTPTFIASLWPLWAVGIFNAMSSFLTAIGYELSERINSRFKKIQVVTGSFVFRRITDSVAFAFPSIFSPALLWLNSVFYGSANVAEDSLLHEEYTDKQRATMGSLDSLLTTACFSIAALGIGFVADAIGVAHTLLLAQILLLPVLLLYFKMFKTSR
ncbi:MAG: MFS transporter [Candidatus Roizmanbacteria bacterium]